MYIISHVLIAPSLLSLYPEHFQAPLIEHTYLEHVPAPLMEHIYPVHVPAPLEDHKYFFQNINSVPLSF